MVISGIIRPPPDIRAVADRTALFVSKNGRAFEIKILNSEKGKTPKFAFLHETSPFHAYYENRIRFYEEGGTDEDEKKEEEDKLRLQREEEEKERTAAKEKEEKEAAAAAQKKKETAKKKASAVDPVARALLACRSRIEDARRGGATNNASTNAGEDAEKFGAEGQEQDEQKPESTTTNPSSGGTGLLPPPPLRHVSLAAPANLTPLEIEVIKLTAQYVALSDKSNSGSGDNFLSNLTLREWTNPEFLFLQPRHSHFAYFTALVDGYRSFLPGGEEYEKGQNKLRENGKKERSSHVIPDDSSVNNGKDEDTTKIDGVADCLESAAYRAEYEREVAERRREAAERAGGGGIFGGAGTIDWHDFVVVETIDFDVDEVVEALPPPTALRLAAMKKEQPTKDGANEMEKNRTAEEGVGDNMDQSASEDDMDMEDGDDDGGEKLKVVSNYQPKVVSTKEITGGASRTHIVDPITGKSVAIADMPEHMRIQLLDPKWAEERRRFLDKQRETNFVAGEDIASNISRFAQARGDIFGSSEDDIRDQKADSERRLMEANRIIREQAMQQPQMQPQPRVLPAPPHSMLPPPPGLPPTQALMTNNPPPPTAVLPTTMAPPPPPPQPIGQPLLSNPPEDNSSAQPTAKRPKIDESQRNLDLNVPMPTAPVPPFGVNVLVTANVPPPPQQSQENLSESDFIATLSNPDEVPISIRVPNDPSNSNWNFNGQTIELTLAATSKIKQLKETLRGELGDMPLNKMQIKHPITGFMNKDGLSLGHFNVGPGMILELFPKTRGGRK